jgi:hypothetical protein
MEITIDAAAEAYVRRLSAIWVAPMSRECMACFVERMLRQFGCDGTLRFAQAYRDLRAPRATGLERRLGAAGGHCDCEVFWNALEPAPHLWVSRRGGGDEGGNDSQLEPPEQMPLCMGVRKGSTQACGLWARQRRPRW